jgi:hypothetical protein
MIDPQALVGRTLAGKYQIVGVIGVGGMGVVVEGRNLELGKRVAIKLIDKSHAQSHELAERLRREARAAAAVESDAIVAVFDVGEDADLGIFMVMEFLFGEDLQTRLHRDRLIDPLLAAQIGWRVARALARAHAAGVVHRDLKPANVFLGTREDGSLMVKVLDFGISKLLHDQRMAAAQQNPGLTRVGMAIGTPNYMSPEQAQGLPTIDHRTDVWALGGVLYEMLAGVPAYPEQATYEQTILKIMTSRPVPLSVSAPWVPPSLCAIVDAALEHELDKRIPDAGTFARRLGEAAGLEQPMMSGGFAVVSPQQAIALVQRAGHGAPAPAPTLTPQIVGLPGAIATPPNAPAGQGVAPELMQTQRASRAPAEPGGARLRAENVGAVIGNGTFSGALDSTVPLTPEQAAKYKRAKNVAQGTDRLIASDVRAASDPPPSAPVRKRSAWLPIVAVLAVGGLAAAAYVVARGGGIGVRRDTTAAASSPITPTSASETASANANARTMATNGSPSVAAPSAVPASAAASAAPADVAASTSASAASTSNGSPRTKKPPTGSGKLKPTTEPTVAASTTPPPATTTSAPARSYGGAGIPQDY